MHVDLIIRRESDGETRTFRNFEWSGDTFIFEDGNYACDCNRQLFFARAGGFDDPDEADMPCGSGKFTITIMRGPYTLYKEYPK